MKIKRSILQSILIIIVIVSIALIYNNSKNDLNIPEFEIVEIKQDSPENLIKSYAVNSSNFINFRIDPSDFVKIYEKVNIHSFDDLDFAGYIDLEKNISESLKGSEVRNMSREEFYKKSLEINSKMNYYTPNPNASIEVYVSNILMNNQKQYVAKSYEISKEKDGKKHLFMYNYTLVEKDKKYYISDMRIGGIYVGMEEDESIEEFLGMSDTRGFPKSDKFVYKKL